MKKSDPEFLGARAQFNSLGSEDLATLGQAVLTARDELRRLDANDDAARWIAIAKEAMEAVIRRLNLPSSRFTLDPAWHGWPILVTTNFTKDPGEFEIVFHPNAINGTASLELRVRELLIEIWLRPIQYLIHHHDGLIQKYVLLDLLRGLKGKSISVVGTFAYETARACGIQELVTSGKEREGFHGCPDRGCP